MWRRDALNRVSSRPIGSRLIGYYSIIGCRLPVGNTFSKTVSTQLLYILFSTKEVRGILMSESTKIYTTTYQTLLQIQEILPGKPSLISLLDEAVKLLAKKYLKEGT